MIEDGLQDFLPPAADDLEEVDEDLGQHLRLRPEFASHVDGRPNFPGRHRLEHIQLDPQVPGLKDCRPVFADQPVRNDENEQGERKKEDKEQASGNDEEQGVTHAAPREHV